MSCIGINRDLYHNLLALDSSIYMFCFFCNNIERINNSTLGIMETPVGKILDVLLIIDFLCTI